MEDEKKMREKNVGKKNSPIRITLTHALALAANRFFHARKSPYEYALGETQTREIDLSNSGGHAKHLPKCPGTPAVGR